MKKTFWELEMTPEELECTVQQHRQRAYTDMCFDYSSFKSTEVAELGSPRSTEIGSSSNGSVSGDASDRWADICDTDDDMPSQPSASYSRQRTASPPSRPEGIWFSPPSPPSRPAGTWFLPPACNNLETQADNLDAQAEALAKRAQELRRAAQCANQQARDERTTLIVKNLPAGCTHYALCRILDQVGLGGIYNFVYVPFDFKKSVAFRYGFVNFEQHEQALRAMAVLDGFSGWVVDSEKGCEVEWSGTQTLHTLVERYRNSPVMHVSVPEVYKPLLLDRGVRIAFPAPTQAVHPPKHAAPEVRSPTASSAPVKQAAAATEQCTTDPDTRTTIIVKNLPEGCTHNELHRILDEVGLGGLYNFIYVPFDFKKNMVLRYGFVNFEQHSRAVEAMALLHGFSGWAVDGEKGCEVEWGGAQQSLQANIERYRNSPLMHVSVPDEYRPVVFNRGVRVAFPAPTQVVKPLKLRKAQQA